MTTSTLLLLALALFTLLSPTLTSSAADPSPNWPSFRGPSATGVADANLPTKWDVSRNENVKWKTPVEGLGHGGPVVWDDKIFLVTAVGASSQPVTTGIYGDIAPVENEKPFEWKLLCLDFPTGKILWPRSAAQGAAKIKRHPKSSHANRDPVAEP